MGLKPSYRRVAAYVALHARWHPARIAVVANGIEITYARLDKDLQAITQALRAFGLPPGVQVAVGHGDFYVQLLIVFGFEALGIATGSFRPMEGPDCHGLTASAELTMVQHGAPKLPCRRLFEITDHWVRASLAAVPAERAAITPAEADEVVFIFRSSGTTGTPKRMQLTQSMVNTRLAQERTEIMALGLSATTRFYALMHFSVGTIAISAMQIFRLGATFMFDTAHGPVTALAAYRTTHITIMPFQLSALLEKLPGRGDEAGPLLPGLMVMIIGAALTEDLRSTALRRLCGRIIEIYGTNESGPISIIDSGGVGTLAGAIEVQVVDDCFAVVAPGEMGTVRLRGSGVVRGYMDDADATAAMFRVGWFYPGDLASQDTQGRLKLLGRRADVLNLGGKKISCATLERKIIASAKVKDVAIVQRNSESIKAPVIACVVADGPADMKSLLQKIRPILNYPFAVQMVAEIPRTPGGKIKRNALLQSLSEQNAEPMLERSSGV